MSVKPPKGLCQCGCGQRTNIASRTDRGWGHIRGEPIRFIRGHQTRKSPVEYVEEDRGHETPCRIWQRSTNNTGYGQIRINGKLHLAHRVAYERDRGEIPDGMTIDHLCRVRCCVNPDHLEAVTNTENVRRGRGAKLGIVAAAQVKASDEPARVLAGRFGVSLTTIYAARNGVQWRDVEAAA